MFSNVAGEDICFSPLHEWKVVHLNLHFAALHKSYDKTSDQPFCLIVYILWSAIALLTRLEV